MSIINDALKKAAKSRHFAHSSNNYLHRRRWVWAGLGTIVVLGIILLTAALKEDTATVTQPKDAGGIFGLREVDIEFASSGRGLTLSGIVFDAENPLAIINGRVVEKGALISGARLVEIQPDFVKLVQNGKEIKLKVK